jgi:hypothetical protein
MTDSLIVLNPAVLAVLPISIGLVQLLKGKFSERVTPFISLLVSTGLAMLAVGELDFSVIIQGIALGLMSMGLFSGAKTTTK